MDGFLEKNPNISLLYSSEIFMPEGTNLNATFPLNNDGVWGFDIKGMSAIGIPTSTYPDNTWLNTFTNYTENIKIITNLKSVIDQTFPTNTFGFNYNPGSSIIIFAESQALIDEIIASFIYS